MNTQAEIGIVGFGEAGRAFASGWALGRGRVCAYDILTGTEGGRAEMEASAGELDVAMAFEPKTLMARADTIFCLVPTDQAVAAAAAMAPFVRPETLWLDGASSSPARKREAAAMVETAGGTYVDMAIMAPVYPKRHRTPVLLSGHAAARAAGVLETLGMTCTVVGDTVGDASAVKMIRSVLVKGLEALTAECFLAARSAGVEQAVLASFAQSDPGVDWSSRTAYNLERMMAHGNRRAAEMREVVSTLTELGLPGRVSEATALWQDEIGDLQISDRDGDLLRRLDTVLAARA